CYLHGNVLSHLFDLVVYNVCLNVNKNADFSAHMCVGSDKSVLFLHLSESSDVHVLADNSDLSCKCFFYALGGIQRPRLSQERVDISCCGCQRLCRNVSHIVLEFLILGNEVCLCVNFNNNRALSVVRNKSLAKTLGCNTAGFLLSCCQTFFTKELYCLVHIAFCGCKSFLAVHHSGAGHFS